MRSAAIGLAASNAAKVSPDTPRGPSTVIAKTVEDINNKGTVTFSRRELTSEKGLTDFDKRAFIEFKPVIDYSALEPGKDATDAIRKAAADLDFAGEYQARVRLTGLVPIANEEFATVQENAFSTASSRSLAVLFILWLALRSAKDHLRGVRRSFRRPVDHGSGGPDAGGLAEPDLGRVCRAVRRYRRRFRHAIRVRYRAERFEIDDLIEALLEAARRARGAPALAAIATAAGFMSFLPTDYRGLSELGLIAGVGMMIAFFASITLCRRC